MKTLDHREQATPRESSAPLLELAVIVPTLNERDNIVPLIQAVKTALETRTFEIIIVDDNSPDGTADIVRQLGQKNMCIRCVQRFGRRGLSSAFLEGALSTAAPIVALIDGDMQHDEKLLPVMLEALQNRELDIVVGSRYLQPEGFGDWAESRIKASKLATDLSKRIGGIQLSDPMSGFFMIRTELIRQLMPKLSAIGFKILLDIFLSASPPLRYKELPYQFRSRHSGETKMDTKVLLKFGELIIEKLVGHIVPAKFVMFSIVGSLGVLVHLAILALMYKGVGVNFGVAQTLATLTAMTSNFSLNNMLTYYDRRLSGWAWIKGWFSFALVSSVGLIANVGIASVLFATYDIQWVLSALAGIIVGLVWNYILTSLFTWRVA